MRISHFCLGFILCVVAVACHKHNEVDTDPTQPAIALISPFNNEVYVSGDSVKIKGSVTDNSLHELRIKITSKPGNNVLFNVVINVHDLTSYNFEQGWKANATTGTDATVEIEAQDHGNHTVDKVVNIRINP